MKTRDRQQNGHIYRRGGWWVLRYRIEVCDGDGKVQVIQRAKKLAQVDAVHKTKASVRHLVEEMLQPVNDQRHSSAMVATTLGDFVTRIYLPFIEEQKRVSTYRGYRGIWRNYLTSPCSGWWQRDVRTCDVQTLLQGVAQKHNLSGTTLRHIKAMLSGVFTFAKRMGYHEGINPVLGVGIPKAHVSGETYAYSLEEVLRIISALPQPAATIAATAAFTGLRRGELQGLLWEAYDGSEIRVTRSVWLGIVDEPKTPQSKAPVPVIAPLQKMLDAYRTSCGTPAIGAMFANKVGKPLCLNNLTNRVIQPRLEYCKQCGQTRADHGNGHKFQRDESRITWRGWHAFRRGLATNLNRLGVGGKTIQAILRHANLSTTMNVYVKTVDADSVKAMKTLERSVRRIVRLNVRRRPSRRKG
jgi:integrase